MAEKVTALETQDPVTTFLTEVHELGPIAWAAISLAARQGAASVWEWDEAFQLALESGGGWAADVAARAAAEVGASAGASALAAGAAAAVSARHSLDGRQFELLFGPVAEVLPRDFESKLRETFVQPVYTSCMPSSTSSESRPLPA